MVLSLLHVLSAKTTMTFDIHKYSGMSAVCMHNVKQLLGCKGSWGTAVAGCTLVKIVRANRTYAVIWKLIFGEFVACNLFLSQVHFE